MGRTPIDQCFVDGSRKRSSRLGNNNNSTNNDDGEVTVPRVDKRRPGAASANGKAATKAAGSNKARISDATAGSRDLYLLEYIHMASGPAKILSKHTGKEWNGWLTAPLEAGGIIDGPISEAEAGNRPFVRLNEVKLKVFKKESGGYTD